MSYFFGIVGFLWLAYSIGITKQRVRRLERALVGEAEPEHPPRVVRRPPKLISAAPPGPDPYGYRCRGCDTPQDTRAVHQCPGARP